MECFMSNTQDPAGAGTSGSSRTSRADAQQLIGLLENLVPLLLQFQTQSFGPGSGRFAGGPGAEVEHRAAVSFTEDIILDAVRNLSQYVKANAGTYPGLDAYARTIADAKAALAARDYQSALALVFEAYRGVTLLRAIRPELPAIRQRQGDEQSAASNGSVH
jgi:hypothetical protein